MSDEPAQSTVRSRALAAGVTAEDLEAHHARGAVRLDGDPVTDLDQPAPDGTRINFAGQ